VTLNPETGQPFIRHNLFGDLVQFSFNLAFRRMAAVAEQMARAEEAV
jgi:hypothetical protein